MLKILVAEDEPPILRGICNKILKAYENCEIVYRSGNGLDAAEYLRKNPVDIVFTDINMPQMSGMELLKFIRQNCPETYTVILSGYQEFQYAREAIQSEAYDYLLKPLETESVRTILETLSRKIHANRLHQVFRGERLGGTDSVLEGERFCFLSICVGAYPGRGDVTGAAFGDYWSQTDINALLLETGVISSPCYILDGRCRMEKIVILEETPEDKTAIVVKRLGRLLEDQQVPFTILVSGQMESAGDLYRQYAKLSIEYPRYIRYGQPGIVFLSNVGLEQEKKILLDEQKLRSCLQKGHVSLFRQELQQLAVQCSEHRVRQSELEKMFAAILDLCRKTEFIKEDDVGLDITIYEVLLQHVDIDSLFTRIIEVLIDAHSARETVISHDKAYLMEQIEKFITAHLSEPITNQLLSEQFGLGAGYISSLFKTYRGTSPSEYLLNARIEKAKELLTRNPELFAKDVAEIVGYADPLYFSRVFKKVTGVYPSEYRKQ